MSFVTTTLNRLMSFGSMGSLMLLYNAKIYQSSGEDNTWMTFHTGNGCISDVGKGNPPLSNFPSDRCKDCSGRRVLPGLHDSHLHVESYGADLNCLNLTGCQSVADFQERIRNYVRLNPDKKWIVGRGWEQDRMGRYPTKDDIDQVCPTIPVLLRRVCGHIAVVNSQALSLAKIDDDSKDPHGGVIERYPPGHKDHGKVNGILSEMALEIVVPLVEVSSEEKQKNIEVAVKELLKNGITSAHACELHTWNEFRHMVEKGKLPIRIFFSGYFQQRKAENFPSAKEVCGANLSCDRVKLFVDGALGSSTAALSQCYHSTDNKGILYYPQAELTQLVREATGLGYRLEIHVIGDDAAENALNALETAKVSPEKRPILTHCQILRSDLLDRMKERGVIANIQPQFVTTDARWLAQLLPPDLLKYSYAWKSLLQKGIPCAGGSDAPVEQPIPLLGIYDAVFRNAVTRTPDNGEVFRPEECLSVREAIDLYTKGGAYAARREDQLGQLLPGYQADFVVLDKDICANPADLLSCKVLEVWVAGRQQI